ncbi:MAG: 50S ribosomal protein L4 [Bacteroidales bacterium]
MELAVYQINGQKTDRKITLDDSVFGIEPNDHVIYLDVKQHMANRRQGTHKTKGRSEVAGSTRKIKRQKGTGTARAGDIKNPLYRGGGRIFGPQPRDYSFKLNKKVKRLARLSAISYKVRENNLFVVEDFTMEGPKTKRFVEVLNGFELNDKKVLLVMDKNDKHVILSSRNLPRTKVILASDINTYDVLNASSILITENSVREIEKNYSVQIPNE